LIFFVAAETKTAEIYDFSAISGYCTLYRAFPLLCKNRRRKENYTLYRIKSRANQIKSRQRFNTLLCSITVLPRAPGGTPENGIAKL